jgi:hypothetical protein
MPSWPAPIKGSGRGPWSVLSLRARSGSRLDLPPEGVHAGVPLVRNLLEGLVGLFLQDLEAGAADKVGDLTADLWAHG